MTASYFIMRKFLKQYDILRILNILKGNTAIRPLLEICLKQLGIELSEPMLFGLGEGLGFIFWNMKMMDFPFIGGRVKPDRLTENLCRNLSLKLEVTETSSKPKAWKNASNFIKQGKAVGLKLDCYHLEYFTTKIHFAGHYVAFYGYDDEYAYLIDTDQQGGKVKTSLKSLELARSEKGSMSSRNLTYIINIGEKSTDLKTAVKQAIKNNAKDFLNPPIKNLGYKGIFKTSSEIKKWFKNSKDVKGDFQTSANLMEHAGTGGSLFRALYRDFLKESAEVLNSKEIENIYQNYSKIAEQWKNVSDLFYEAGETQDFKYINQASEMLIQLSKNEQITMMNLEKAFSD